MIKALIFIGIALLIMGELATLVGVIILLAAGGLKFTDYIEANTWNQTTKKCKWL